MIAILYHLSLLSNHCSSSNISALSGVQTDLALVEPEIPPEIPPEISTEMVLPPEETVPVEGKERTLLFLSIACKLKYIFIQFHQT